MIDWPHSLINSVARRRAVVFLGAGVSMNSQNIAGKRPPSWRAFLESGIELCTGSKREIRQHLKNGDLLTCCQMIKDRLGDEWLPLIDKEFLQPAYKAHDIHASIFRLDASIVMTPNFDKIYDTYATATSDGQVQVKSYYDPDIARIARADEKFRCIVKIHGTVDRPADLIFTRHDYARARIKHADFYQVLDALILTHTFLFIGCGMTDPDLLLLLERYNHAFANTPPHFLLMARPVSDAFAQVLRSNYNIKVLAFSKKDDYKELFNSLDELGKLVEKKGDELAAAKLS